MKIPEPRSKAWRILNRNNSFNVAKKGRRKIFFSDLYHSLLSASWPLFFLFVLVFYLWINIVFALGYFLCGPGALMGINHTSIADAQTAYFFECFFFSVQTLATIGYGRVSPFGLMPNFLVTFEALVGLLSLAIVTGLLYARFSRPTARVVFSRVAIIGKHNGVPCLYFRMANERLNQIAEAHVNVMLVKNEVSLEGEDYRNFYDLALERQYSPLFTISWTVVHPITASSPLYEATKEKLLADNVEILVTLTGTDDTFSQPIHARFSYTPDEILWNARFKDILSQSEDGKVQIALEDIHDLKEA